MNEDLLEIERLVVADELKSASARIAALQTRDVRDARLHLKLADLCEAVGDGERLVVELNFAYRDAPEETDILKRLGQVHADAGRTERAIKCWRAVVERRPEDVEAWEELAIEILELARVEEARDVYTRALQATGDRRFLALLRNLEDGRREESAAESSVPTDAILSRFVSLFNGREGVYARQWVNPQGQSGYTPIHEPFTVAVARNHLLGNHTVGIYPVRLDNTVNFLALDLDLSRPLVERSRPGRPEWDGAMGRLMEYARRAWRLGSEHDLRVYLEDSGSKGIHCWIFLSEPMPARMVRALGQGLLRALGPPPGPEVGVELFPKQATLPTNGLGNLIKLPLGIHRSSGRRAEFVEPDGRRIADQMAHLNGLTRTDRTAVLRFAEQSTAIPEIAPEPSPWEDEPTATAVRPTSVQPEYHVESDAAVMTLFAHCATLRELTEKIEHESAITNDEAMVLLHSVGHLETGPSAVNALLRKCPGTDPALFMKSRLRGNPISCPKIRSRIPHVTSRVPCNCEFNPGAGLYPNPLLHLQGGATHSAGDLNTLQFQALLQDFLRIRRELHEAQRLYELNAERLAAWFERAGIDEFRTPLGLLKRVPSGEGDQPSFQLEV